MARRDAELAIEARQTTVVPTSIPAYASACSGRVLYSSACSCIGVTAMTTTALAPSTTVTVTTTTSTTQIAAPAEATLTVSEYRDLETCSFLDFLNNITLTPNECVTATEATYVVFNPPISLSGCSPLQPVCVVTFYASEICTGAVKIVLTFAGGPPQCVGIGCESSEPLCVDNGDWLLYGLVCSCM
jgi:hypothetical protein